MREGINIFLAGFIPQNNHRFRDHELTFQNFENKPEMEKIDSVLSYPAMTKTYDSFKISIQPGKY